MIKFCRCGFSASCLIGPLGFEIKRHRLWLAMQHSVYVFLLVSYAYNWSNSSPLRLTYKVKNKT